MAAKKPTKRSVKEELDISCKSSNKSCNSGGYFLGFLGSAVYYISTASGFWAGVLGFLKAMVWPAFVVYEVLKYVGA